MMYWRLRLGFLLPSQLPAACQRSRLPLLWPTLQSSKSLQLPCCVVLQSSRPGRTSCIRHSHSHVLTGSAIAAADGLADREDAGSQLYREQHPWRHAPERARCHHERVPLGDDARAHHHRHLVARH